jgi:hypothetical protein
LNTVLHVYKTVSAQLFRAQERSSVAEEAWAHAAHDDEIQIESTDPTFITRLDMTRRRALAIIRDASLPLSLAEKAMAALNHAYYAAITEVRQPDATSNA